ncbi:MAG: hypothetical protein JW762_06460 [Dehalococcoidales bacterium]|nr:hypothetical protein [Dehalococcoidales bacterium]
MNRDDVLQKLEPVMKTQVRTIEHSPQTRINVTPEMIEIRPGNRQHALTLSKEGITSLSKYIGLPDNVTRKLRPQTFGAVATELLYKKGQYTLMVKDGYVTGIANPNEYRGLNPTRVLAAIERGIRGIDYHRVLILDNYVVSLELIGEKREPVVRGDLVQAGANVTFSPIGTVNPSVSSFALRLACTNGAVHNQVLREFTYGGGGGDNDGDDIFGWFRESAKEAYNSLNHIVNRYRVMIEEEIPPEHRASVLEAMLKEARISGSDANAIRALALENPPQNSYDMMNLITNATSHLLENPNRVRSAQIAVAGYASSDEHTRICPVCHARRQGPVTEN